MSEGGSVGCAQFWKGVTQGGWSWSLAWLQFGQCPCRQARWRRGCLFARVIVERSRWLISFGRCRTVANETWIGVIHRGYLAGDTYVPHGGGPPPFTWDILGFMTLIWLLVFSHGSDRFLQELLEVNGALIC